MCICLSLGILINSTPDSIISLKNNQTNGVCILVLTMPVNMEHMIIFEIFQSHNVQVMCSYTVPIQIFIFAHNGSQ